MGYLTVNKVATDLKVTPLFVYREIAAKRLPAIKLGAPGSKRPTIRIPVEAFEAWKQKQLEATE